MAVNWRKPPPAPFLAVVAGVTAVFFAGWLRFGNWMLEQAPKDPTRKRTTLFLDTETADIMLEKKLKPGAQHRE